ncbi:1 [Hexamita inflata]|uniref:1 n=1 Tax=Hexamita inflata TaxID=28002 RepID=A0AA86TPT0_9EUKA|nr:1 [Hexamita inflata] [Hexamita inflata]
MLQNDNFQLFSRNSQLEDQNGVKVNIKGYNYFGFETQVAIVHGLWSRNLESLLDQTYSEGFNAIRIPFSCELALNLTLKQPVNEKNQFVIDYELNPKLKGLTSAEILDYLINAAAARGIVILLDMHRLYGAGDIDPLWYDSNFSEDKVIQGWQNMVQRYNQWNVIGVDIKNEPHDEITWGTGNISSDFDLYCQRAGDIIHQINPKLLIFVEGIHKWKNWDYSCWGESLQGVLENPVTLKIPNKVVYSPHVYGMAVSGMPNNDTEKWESRFGYIVTQKLGPAVVIGEWGGDIVDYQFIQNFAQWMILNKITDNFHWALNPNTGQAEGLVYSDWITLVRDKLDIIKPIIKQPFVFPHVATCSSLIPFMNGTQCQRSCSSGYYSIIFSVFICQPICSLYYKNSTNTNLKQCVAKCPDAAPFLDGNHCVVKQQNQTIIIIGVSFCVLILSLTIILVYIVTKKKGKVIKLVYAKPHVIQKHKYNNSKMLKHNIIQLSANQYM